MKSADISKSVMEQVARFEEERSTRLLRRFRIGMMLTAVFLVFVAWRISTQVRDSGSLDLLSIFWEDAEIAAEFWRENVSVFFEELPQGAVVILLSGVILSTGFVTLTRRRRKIAERRLRELAKRKAFRR